MERLAAEAADALAGAPADEVIAWAVRTFGRRICITSSMTDAVLVNLVAKHLPGVDVLFLDTGYHFPETVGTRDAVAAVYPVNVINVTPPTTVAEQDAELGPRLYSRNPDLCCYLRKVVPLEEALGPYDAWFTGVRREEEPSDMERLAADAADALAGAPADEVIAWAVRTFGRRICITSSMTDAVLVNLVAKHLPGIDVLFLDTGYHFPETGGPLHLWGFLWRWPAGSRDTLVRERVSADKLGAACLGHPVSQPTLGPLG